MNGTFCIQKRFKAKICIISHGWKRCPWFMKYNILSKATRFWNNICFFHKKTQTMNHENENNYGKDMTQFPSFYGIFRFFLYVISNFEIWNIFHNYLTYLWNVYAFFRIVEALLIAKIVFVSLKICTIWSILRRKNPNSSDF